MINKLPKSIDNQQDNISIKEKYFQRKRVIALNTSQFLVPNKLMLVS